MLGWVNARYRPGEIYITENGCDVPDESSLPLPAALDDGFRRRYYAEHVQQATLAVREDGVPLRGYFAWSLLDNFEWCATVPRPRGFGTRLHPQR